MTTSTAYHVDTHQTDNSERIDALLSYAEYYARTGQADKLAQTEIKISALSLAN